MQNHDGVAGGTMQKLDIKESASLSAELAGLTFAVKDMFALAGRTTGFGCPDWHKTHWPSPRNATAVQMLLDAGANLTARAVCDELAFSLDGINVHYGTPPNPRDLDRIPGGSSSGSASLVAQGAVDFALGTDTAGSTRVPASYCGIFGLRPTQAAISCDGVLPLGPSFDTVGLLTSTLPVMQRVSQIFFADHNFGQTKKLPKNLVIVSECFGLLEADLLPPVMAAVNRLGKLFEFVETKNIGVDLPVLVKNFAAIRSVEAWQCHGQWFEQTAPNLGQATAARLSTCCQFTKAGADEARLYRLAEQIKFDEWLEDSVFCLPTTVGPAPLLSASADVLEANRNLNLQLTVISSFIGLPQLTIPLPLSNGAQDALAPGLSIIGRAGSEKMLLEIAARLTDK